MNLFAFERETDSLRTCSYLIFDSTRAALSRLLFRFFSVAWNGLIPSHFLPIPVSNIMFPSRPTSCCRYPLLDTLAVQYYSPVEYARDQGGMETIGDDLKTRKHAEAMSVAYRHEHVAQMAAYCEFFKMILFSSLPTEKWTLTRVIQDYHEKI